MKNDDGYSKYFNGLVTIVGWLPVWLVLLWAQGAVYANGDASHSGGHVVNAGTCAEACADFGELDGYSSLFAVADSNYRFIGWQGVCADSFGPLCTTRYPEQAQARFTKIQPSNQSDKAVLLLHDPAASPSVWNDWVGQRFQQRCSLVYAGVVLDSDAVDDHSQTYCYRMAFGYYAMLSADPDAKATPASTPEQLLAYEVRAALLGLLSRHPNLDLTLITQGRAEAVTQQLFSDDSMPAKVSIRLLALHSSEPVAENTGNSAAMARIQATPSQVSRINAALQQLQGERPFVW